MTKSKYRLPLLWGIFAVYSVLTLLGALNHEVWLDEAQAWVILRDCPLSELPYRLNVEGHPPLWYLILYPFVKLGFPADYVSLISWFFMAAGALVLLFKVELPLPLKAVILASSGFLYFNSVMLRVYCLIPPLMFLILWVYPKRREHAVIYGLLIALLANTHIFICGIVGILGIFMLYDLFAEWKKSSKKENAGKLIGLAIAGIGVLALVIPLIGSIEANGATRNSPPGLSVGSFFRTLGDTFLCSFFPGGANYIVWGITASVFNILAVGMMIILRHWRRAFAVEIGFIAFYYVACGVFWVTIPNRAAVFFLSFAFVLCLEQYEKPVFREYKFVGQLTGLVGCLMKCLIKADKNAKKVYTVILTVFFAATIPSGVSLLLRDIGENYCGAKEIAAYISENFDEDAVFVQYGDGMPEVSFYAPEVKIFATDVCGLTTYAQWEYRNYPKEPSDDVAETLSGYDELYYIYYYTGSKSETDEALFIAHGFLNIDRHNSIALSRWN